MNEQAIIVWARTGPPSRPPLSGRSGAGSSPERPPLVSPQSLRDLVLFLSGLGLLFHQSVVAPEAQEILVAAALALIFGPVPLRLDERRKNGANGS